MLNAIGVDFHSAYQVNENNQLFRLAFFHKHSIRMLRLYGNILIIDATYNTNRFGLFLVEIIGVTTTNHSFLVGQAFVANKGKEDYN